MEHMNKKEIQLYNRRTLHKNDKRCCYECRIIYDNIREHFHIKKRNENGDISSWSTTCKSCKNKYHRQLISDYRKDYSKKIKSNMSALKFRAKEIGVPYDLDFEYLVDLFEKQNEKCYYTKEPISFENTVISYNHPHRFVPSLDRLYPEIGYVKGNVVWSCYYVNRIKNDLNVEEFYLLCEKILENKIE